MTDCLRPQKLIRMNHAGKLFVRPEEGASLLLIAPKADSALAANNDEELIAKGAEMKKAYRDGKAAKQAAKKAAVAAAAEAEVPEEAPAQKQARVDASSTMLLDD